MMKKDKTVKLPPSHKIVPENYKCLECEKKFKGKFALYCVDIFKDNTLNFMCIYCFNKKNFDFTNITHRSIFDCNGSGVRSLRV